MSPKLSLAFGGVGLNLFVVSAPLFAFGMFWSNLGNINLIAFYLAISCFCFAEILADNSDLELDKGSAPYLPQFVGLALLGLIWVSIYTSDLSGGWAPICIGCLLVILGTALRAISITTLRAQFLSHISLRSDHYLHMTGLYRFIRHPSELGLLLIGLGIPVLLSSGVGIWMFALLLCPLSLYRIALEDRMMHDAFELEFTKYKNTTPALFPKLNSLLRT